MIRHVKMPRPHAVLMRVHALVRSPDNAAVIRSGHFGGGIANDLPQAMSYLRPSSDEHLVTL